MPQSSGNDADVAPSRLSAEQREAIGKWRWLGWRGSTPAFKASLALLAAVTFALAAYYAVVIPH